MKKDFTGENSQKKSTGMGLYLVRQIGQELKIEVEAVSVYGKGMEIRLWFPVVYGQFHVELLCYCGLQSYCLQ